MEEISSHSGKRRNINGGTDVDTAPERPGKMMPLPVSIYTMTDVLPNRDELSIQRNVSKENYTSS